MGGALAKRKFSFTKRQLFPHGDTVQVLRESGVSHGFGREWNFRKLLRECPGIPRVAPRMAFSLRECFVFFFFGGGGWFPGLWLLFLLWLSCATGPATIESTSSQWQSGTAPPIYRERWRTKKNRERERETLRETNRQRENEWIYIYMLWSY